MLTKYKYRTKSAVKTFFRSARSDGMKHGFADTSSMLMFSQWKNPSNCTGLTYNFAKLNSHNIQFNPFRYSSSQQVFAGVDNTYGYGGQW